MAPPTPTVTPIIVFLAVVERPLLVFLSPSPPENPGVDTTRASELPTCVCPLESVVVKKTVWVLVTGVGFELVVLSDVS